MSSPVLLAQDSDIWRMTLNAPERRNALSVEMVEAIHAVFDVVALERPRGLIVSGAGPVFCAGLDLAELETRSDGDMLWLLTRIELMLQRLWSLPCRTLGLAQKAAIGAGADILVCCQHRVLSEGGRMGFPGLGFGIFLGTNRLSLRIGAGAAETLLAAGAPVEAARAHALGLIHETPSDPEAAVANWAAQIRAQNDYVAAHLSTTVARADHAADMAALIASAARPGLRERIADYVARQNQAKNQKIKG